LNGFVRCGKIWPIRKSQGFNYDRHGAQRQLSARVQGLEQQILDLKPSFSKRRLNQRALKMQIQ
jgi:hypothetical protein